MLERSEKDGWVSYGVVVTGVLYIYHGTWRVDVRRIDMYIDKNKRF